LGGKAAQNNKKTPVKSLIPNSRYHNSSPAALFIVDAIAA